VSVIAAEHRSHLYALRALWHLPNAIVAVATGIAFSWLVLDLHLGDVSWPALVLCVLAATLSVAAYALFAGNIALVLREYVAAMSLSSGLLLICSGVVIPSERVARAIEWVANGLPLTHALRGFRAAFEGASLPTVASDAAWEVVVAALFLLGGSALFARITDTARTTGSFELGEN